MGRRRSGRRLLTAVITGVLAIALAAPSFGAPKQEPAAPGVTPQAGRSTEGRTVKVVGRLNAAKGPTAAFIELATTPAVDAADPDAAKAQSDDTSDAVVADVESKDASAQELYRTSNAVPGVAVIADAETLREISARGDVKSVRTLVPKRFDNAEAAQLTRVLNVWQDLGLFGDGMKVGIIDTGIDYTHSNFGGPGTSEYYDSIDPTDATGVFPTFKVVGGYDFAGDDYDADSDDPEINTPVPDDNPLDCQGHGSHVAGTAGGFGVNDDGSTFTGDYSALTGTDLDGMRIGPGMAPNASLYALKVFGCDGSTFLTAQALDWALDPDGNGDFSDHLDLINASLGSDYGAPDDPEALFVRKLAENGVLSVISAGNGGDFYDVGGSPGNTPEALTVASTRDQYVLRDYIQATAPPTVVGDKPGQYSVAFDYEGLDFTDDVINLSGVRQPRRL